MEERLGQFVVLTVLKSSSILKSLYSQANFTFYRLSYGNLPSKAFLLMLRLPYTSSLLGVLLFQQPYLSTFFTFTYQSFWPSDIFLHPTHRFSTFLKYVAYKITRVVQRFTQKLDYEAKI